MLFHMQQDRGTPILLFLVLVLLTSALAVYVYPWADLTYSFGKTAGSERQVPERPLAATITSWCVNFAPYSNASQLSAPMRDDGMWGDKLAADGIYSLKTVFAGEGIHYWSAAACDSPAISFPQEPAWLWATTPNQEMLLTFDTNRYADAGQGTLWPQAFITNASDDLPPLYVFGSVNDWKKADESARLQQSRKGNYRLEFSVPNKGKHTAAVVFMAEDGNLHGFMGDGRSESWNMLELETRQNNETVLFEVDPDTGRSRIVYGIPGILNWLAYGRGQDILPLAIAVSALLLTFLALKRYNLLRRPELYAGTGCPDCGNTPIVRIPRTKRMHLARMLAVTTGNYVCRQCDWQGTRLVGGTAAVAVSNMKSLNRRLPIMVTMLLLLLFSLMAVLLRAESGTSLSWPVGEKAVTVPAQGFLERLEPQSLQTGPLGKLLEYPRDWLKAIGLLLENEELPDNGVTPAAGQSSDDVSGAKSFSPVQYDSQSAADATDVLPQNETLPKR